MKICLSCEGVTNTDAERCGHCGAWMLPTDAVHYPSRRGEAESTHPLLGTVVDGKYRLQAVLGRGGLGTVFQAVHTGSLMQVALKLLHPRFAEREEYRRALLPEARRAATVTHQRCARLLDVGEADEGSAYLAMELVDGDTLEEVMRDGPIEPSQAVQVLEQVAEALVAIHAAGLVHCDLSPRNVMVGSRDGQLRVKVLDFGIARTVTMAGDRVRGGELSGFVNPVFSAPEVLRDEDVDPRADLYSFGSLAWLLLTGTAPVDDTDSRRAAVAVAAGELRPWPAVSGVPRRLQRLVRRCLAHDRELRPPTAAAVLRELVVIRSSRRPLLARSAVAAAALGVVAAFAGGGRRTPPFLRPWAGSALVLADAGTARATAVQHVTSARLAQLGFDFGGFAPQHLRVDLARDGVVLLRCTLQPEVDAAGAVLTLATAQPGWRSAVEGLLQSSREGPVDVSFVAPGRAPFGAARLRLDDDAPLVDGRLELGEGDRLTGAARLAWRIREDIGLAAASAEVRFDSGERVALPLVGPDGDLEFGAALAALAPGVEPRGGGEVALIAMDLAGNRGEAVALPFAACDVEAPAVLEVTGPEGEAFVPVGSGTLRLRVRASATEADCTLRVTDLADRELVHVALPDPGPVHSLELPLPAEMPVSGPVWFTVEDRAGNQTRRQHAWTLRRIDLELDVSGVAPGAVWFGRELVMGDQGAEAVVTVAPPFRVTGAAVELARATGGADAGPFVHLAAEAEGHVRCRFGPLPPGSHELRLELDDGAGETAHRSVHAVALRVLPPVVELRVPATRSRFLPGLVGAGVLTRRAGGLGEGPGWRLDPALRPYVRGTLWVGATDLVPLPLPDRDQPNEPLLPDIVPVPGRNVFALDLRDVLGRPARVVVGDGSSAKRRAGDVELDVVADFWWHDAVPEPIGEELLVEYAQPARLRLRFPLPFRADERDELRLGIAQGEITAAQVATLGDGAVVSFELPFEVWSVAAQLAGRTREDFPVEIERRVDAYVATPAGRQSLVLRLRTTRSTLQPFELGELGVPGALPPGLAAIRLLPVLAPVEAFTEPVPAAAPPRALFRPQPPVAVRNIADFLLQDREFECGAARALVSDLERWTQGVDPLQLVHRDDPLGTARLQPGKLLPAGVADAAADHTLAGVDFYQAYTLCRLLGVAVARDPGLFRLPLGCELELAAFANARRAACHGAGASGGTVSMQRFLLAARRRAGDGPTAAEAAAAGDVVPTEHGAPFHGLDFGVREWVLDLPHVPGAELLLREWTGDHAAHLARLESFARGAAAPPADLAAPLRTLGVVRGLALGEVDDLVVEGGRVVDARSLTTVPDSVPGVLRTEQLARDGRDLLTTGRDPRLARVGFRVAGTAAVLSRLRGWR